MMKSQLARDGRCRLVRIGVCNPSKLLLGAIALIVGLQLLAFIGGFPSAAVDRSSLLSELLTFEAFVAAGSGASASAVSVDALPWCKPTTPVDPSAPYNADLSRIAFEAGSLSTAGCRVPIVVYAWNRPQYLQRCLATLTALAYATYNGADDVETPTSSCSAVRKPQVGVFLYLDGAAPEMLAAVADATSGRWSLLPEEQRSRLPRCAVNPGAGDPVLMPAPLVRTVIRPVASWHPPPAQSGFFGLKQHWLWMMQHVLYSSAVATSAKSADRSALPDGGAPASAATAAVPELASAHAADVPLLFIEDDMALSADALPVYRAVAQLLRMPSVCSQAPVDSQASARKSAATGTAASGGDAAAAPTRCWGGALSNFGFSLGADASPLSFRVMHGHSAAAYMISRSGWEAIAGCSAAEAYGERPHGHESDTVGAGEVRDGSSLRAGAAAASFAHSLRDRGRGRGRGSHPEAGPAGSATLDRLHAAASTASRARHGSSGFSGFLSRLLGGGDAAASAQVATLLGTRPFHPSCSGLAHFAAFGDGWDWSFAHLQQRGGLAPSFIVPALSRVRNFGARGVTISEDSYAASGLGTTPVSKLTAAEFAAAMTADNRSKGSPSRAGQAETAASGAEAGKRNAAVAARFELVDARSPADLPASKPCRGCGVRAIANHDGSDQMCDVCKAS